MAKKKLIIFIPSIEGGGLEKNFLLVTNFLSKTFNKITVITSIILGVLIIVIELFNFL